LPGNCGNRPEPDPRFRRTRWRGNPGPGHWSKGARVSGIRSMGTSRQLASLIGIAVMLAAGIFFLSTRASDAAESCQGLDTALRNNLGFIAGQQANPDANSAARIANRQAVVDLIQQRRRAAGCVTNANAGQAGNAGKGDAGQAGNGGDASQATNADKGDVGCAGSTVTLSGEGGAPAASSNQFPIGTKLKVTNLDNNKTTTVAVTSVSGSCALLNNAAFEQIREPGKFLIRRAMIERVG